MKTARLMLSFLNKNLIPILILIITTTVSLFFLVSAYGEYMFINRAKNAFENAGLGDAVYFMYHPADFSASPAEGSNASKSVVSSLPACKEIIAPFCTYGTVGETYLNVHLWNGTMIRSFALSPDKGRWLDPDSETPEAVVNDASGNAKLGDMLLLPDGTEARIVGIIAESAFIASFNHGSSAQSASDLFKTDTDVAFVNFDSLSEKMLEAISPSPSLCYYVRISPNATDGQRSQLLGTLSSYGNYADYDTITKNTNAEVDRKMRESLPLPIFILTATAVIAISICTLSIKRNMSEQARYFLIGCSKRRSLLIIITSLAAAFSIPCIANLVLALKYPYFLRYGARVDGSTLIGTDCSAPILLYLGILLLISAVIPAVYYRRFSPLDFYRRTL